jgi:hypothetical protein
VAWSGYYTKCIGAFKVWSAIFDRLRPAFVEFEDSVACSSSRRLKQIHEVPIRMLTLFHAIFTIVCSYTYLFGLLEPDWLDEARTVSTAYLAFDLVQNFKMWQQRGFEGVSSHPIGILFHHVATVLFIHGFLPGCPGILGLLVYYCAEVAVAFLNITWFLFYLEQSSSRECMVCANLTVLSYFLCRIVLFPGIFFIYIYPRQPWFSPVTWLLNLVFAIVYGLNFLWFVWLLEKNQRFLPTYVVASLGDVPQYYACDLTAPAKMRRLTTTR